MRRLQAQGLQLDCGLATRTPFNLRIETKGLVAKPLDTPPIDGYNRGVRSGNKPLRKEIMR